MKKIINQLENIGETIVKKDLVKQILNSCPKNMDSLSITLIYCYDLSTLNDLTWIFLHDEAKELQGKKTENEVFFIKSKFNKTKLHQFDKNTRKGLAIKREGNCNFCGSLNHWMQSCVKLSNEIKHHNVECEHLKKLINMIREAMMRKWTTSMTVIRL